MTRLLVISTFLSTSFLVACDSSPVTSNITPRSEPECSLCVEELTGKDKVGLLEYDCSLGTMLACLELGIMTEDECMKLVLLQGGQLDTYLKWQIISDEATQECAKVCN